MDTIGLPVRGVEAEVGMIGEMVRNVERRAERAQRDEETRTPLARPLPARRQGSGVRRKRRGNHRKGNILAADDEAYAFSKDICDRLRFEWRSAADGRERQAPKSVVCAPTSRSVA